MRTIVPAVLSATILLVACWREQPATVAAQKPSAPSVPPMSPALQQPAAAIPELPADVMAHAGQPTRRALGFASMAEPASLAIVAVTTTSATVGADPSIEVAERYQAWIGANRRRASEAPICWKCPTNEHLEFGCTATRRADTCKLAERVTLVVNGRVELVEDVAAGECDLWFSADFERVGDVLPPLAGQLRGSSGWALNCQSVTARWVLQ